MGNVLEIPNRFPEPQIQDELRIIDEPMLELGSNILGSDDWPDLRVSPEILFACSQQETSGETSQADEARVGETIVWDEIKTFHPILDFVDDTAYITLNLDVAMQNEGRRPTITSIPHLVSSSGIVEVLNDDLMHRPGLRLYKVPTQAPSHRWGKRYLRTFRDGERSVDPRKLFEDIVAAFKAYVYFEESDVYPFIALWVMGTYLFPLFPAFPMVLLNGPKRSGKSRTLITTSLLAFNAMPIGDPTGAIIFRLIDEYRPTLIFDETEWLSKKELDSSISDILKFGYKPGFKVARCMYQGKNPYVERYESYCPKMFSNIRGAEDVLADRTIIITQRRKPSELRIADIDPTDEQPMWAELRHRLYLFMFSAWQDIRRLIPSQSATPLRDREYEMAAGILAIASYLERVSGREGLSKAILAMMMRISDERESSDISSNHDSIVIQALLSLVERDDWFSVYSVMEEIKRYRVSNSDWINEEWTGRTLLRLGIGKHPDFKKRAWTVTDAGKKNLTHYYIERLVVEDLAKKYGVPYNPRYLSDPEPGYAG